jgi:uncharacterized hydantoinase/oxoprolinase family protein
MDMVGITEKIATFERQTLKEKVDFNMEKEIRKMFESIKNMKEEKKLRSFHIWMYKNMIDLYSQKLQFQSDIDARVRDKIKEELKSGPEFS